MSATCLVLSFICRRSKLVWNYAVVALNFVFIDVIFDKRMHSVTLTLQLYKIDAPNCLS